MLRGRRGPMWFVVGWLGVVASIAVLVAIVWILTGVGRA